MCSSFRPEIGTGSHEGKRMTGTGSWAYVRVRSSGGESGGRSVVRFDLVHGFSWVRAKATLDAGADRRLGEMEETNAAVSRRKMRGGEREDGTM